MQHIKLSPLERFIGSDARVLGGTDITISNAIAVQRLQVSFPEEQMPDETGKLYLFPIDDGRYCLQLCYMMYGEGKEQDSAQVHSIVFQPVFFEQFPVETLMANQPFRFDQTTEQQFSVCSQSAQLLEQLDGGEVLTPFTRALHRGQVAISLLKRALECITIPFTTCQVPACRFLAFETERDKIRDARIIIEQSIEQPLTIRELSRKVAMNECYLKKGFKALTGKTIHEYQQELRISKAKELLQGEGRSVTDVAATLGYSSISHFSTAFKRVTGLKPCELLA